MTAEELLQRFLTHVRIERGLSPATWKAYGYQIQHYLRFLEERGQELILTGRDEVLAYIENRKDGGLASSSLFAAAIAIRQFYRFLGSQGIPVKDSPSSMLLPKFSQRLPDPLSINEMERLLGLPTGEKFHRIRNHAMLELLYSTGIRVSELVGLKIDQVNLGEASIKVVGKGNRERILPMGPKAIAAIEGYLESRRNRYPQASTTLFLNSRGQGLQRGGFWRELRGMAKEAGLTGRVFPHRIRHTFGTHLLAGGADLRVVQETLGHRSITMTQRYTHVAIELMRRSVQKAHPRF